VSSPLHSFDELPDSVAILDRVVIESLTSLHAELPRWYEREQEVVSLYAFAHLAPVLHREQIDAGQLVIEGRVPQLACKTGTEPHPSRPELDRRARRDLVIRRRRHHGCFRVPEAPDCPFAVMEWKLSIAKRTSKRLVAEFETDVQWLVDNGDMMQVGYGVFVEWPDGNLRIRCVRVQGRELNRGFLGLPSSRVTIA